MKLLLEYMYGGSISVNEHEIQDIIRSASYLQIRGLTQPESRMSEIYDTPPSILVDERHIPSNPTSDKFLHLEIGSWKSGDSTLQGSHSRKAGGRKNSAPKKVLRLSVDNESKISSPRYMNRISEDEDRVERLCSSVSPMDDNIALSEDLEPLDLSTGITAETPNKFSILGPYLNDRSKEEEEHSQYDRKRAELFQHLAAAWRNKLFALAVLQNMGSMPTSKDDSYDMEEDNKKSTTESMDREKVDTVVNMRSQFFANLPTQVRIVLVSVSVSSTS